MRRPVAIVGFGQTPSVRSDERNEVELVMDATARAFADANATVKEMGFICSGSCDFLLGLPFSFVVALDAVGAWPPVSESHVEMDGAWALAEAVTRLQHGDIDTALVYGFGKSSLAPLRDVLCLQLDPYTLAPLWPDSVSLAALQAKACLDAGTVTERQMAEVVARSRRAAVDNPNAQLSGTPSVDELLAAPVFSDPLRKHDLPPISDAACAIVLAAGDAAQRYSERPAWITGLDHRIEAHQLGQRDLIRSVSTRMAGEKAGVGAGPIDVAEVYAPFSHQEVLVLDALGIDADRTQVNPSGGTLSAHAFMAAGLTRFGEAAARIRRGDAERVVAHATSGPLLQHNMVGVMSATRPEGGQ